MSEIAYVDNAVLMARTDENLREVFKKLEKTVKDKEQKETSRRECIKQ